MDNVWNSSTKDYISYNGLKLLSLPRYTKNIYDTIINNYSSLLPSFISNMNDISGYNNIVFRLTNFFSLHNILKYTFNDLCKNVVNTKVIYVILTNKRLYIGQTMNYYNRMKQHLSLVRNLLLHKNNKDIINTNKYNCLDVSKNANKLLYKYISKENFIILPMLRVSSIDALIIENIIIKQFAHTSLNLPSKYSDNILINNKRILYSTNKHRRMRICDKNRNRTSILPSDLKQEQKQQGLQKVNIVLFEKDGILYHSLLTILSNYVDVSITVKMYRYGGLRRCDLKICIYSFGDSIVKYNDTLISMKDFIMLLYKEKFIEVVF